MRVNSVVLTAALIAGFAVSAAAQQTDGKLVCSGRTAVNADVLSFSLDVQTPATASRASGNGEANTTTYSQLVVDLPLSAWTTMATAAYEATGFGTCQLTYGRANVVATFTQVHVDDVKLLSTVPSEGAFIAQCTFDYVTMGFSDEYSTITGINTEALWTETMIVASLVSSVH